MKMIRSLPEFAESFNFDETEKKVMIVTVDGGPDENPRYQKTIASAIEYFEEYQLDALFLATNAPGRSVFNRTERRIAPLSREISGFILPNETFGSQLDGNGKPIDDALELKTSNMLEKCWLKSGAIPVGTKRSANVVITSIFGLNVNNQILTKT